MTKGAGIFPSRVPTINHQDAKLFVLRAVEPSAADRSGIRRGAAAGIAQRKPSERLLAMAMSQVNQKRNPVYI